MKKLILRATHPQDDGSILCTFSKSIFVDGVEQDRPEGHLLLIPRYVGANNDIPSNRPYLRYMLDRAADELGRAMPDGIPFESCSDEDWQTILKVCEAVWGELPPDPDWTPPTPEELIPHAVATPN